MAQKQLNPILKLALELGPIIAYFAIYMCFKDQTVTVGGTEYSGIIVATAVLVPLILTSLAISWVLTRTLPRMAVFTAIMVVVFGGLTVFLNDETFTKMRPTVVYGLFGGLLGWGLFVRGQSYLKYLMDQMMPLQDKGWMLFTRNWVFFFVFMAVFNEFVWRVMGEEAWVWLDSFGQMILTFLFLATQFPLLQKYSLDERS